MKVLKKSVRGNFWARTSLSGLISDVNFCKDHRDKTEVPDLLAVEDLISHNFNNRKLARLIITQYISNYFLSNFPQNQTVVNESKD